MSMTMTTRQTLKFNDPACILSFPPNQNPTRLDDVVLLYPTSGSSRLNATAQRNCIALVIGLVFRLWNDRFSLYFGDWTNVSGQNVPS